jgi:drug/metabolite transporter (DMT)-like permease
MGKKMSTVKIIGIVLLIVGVVVLVLGAYNLISFNTSTGGKILNKTAGFFGTQTEQVRNAIIMMVIGAVAAVAGFLVYKKR